MVEYACFSLTDCLKCKDWDFLNIDFLPLSNLNFIFFLSVTYLTKEFGKVVRLKALVYYLSSVQAFLPGA